MYFLCIIMGKNKHIYEYILKEENGKLCCPIFLAILS